MANGNWPNADVHAIKEMHHEMLNPDENQTPAAMGEYSPAPNTSLSPGDPSADSGAAATTHNALRHEIRVWTRDLLIAIGLALVIIVFLYQPVKVEGTSMAP